MQLERPPQAQDCVQLALQTGQSGVRFVVRHWVRQVSKQDACMVCPQQDVHHVSSEAGCEESGSLE